MGLKWKIIKGNELCWLHFKLDEPNHQCGDYAYLKGYNPNRSEKIEDGEVYVKVRIRDVWWKYGKVCFNSFIVNKDGTENNNVLQFHDPERLTIITD